ncbi:phospholipase D-like domain-containing protein [Lichenihabitans psoromatis]|uniref:phospholipase D-like domain-containing protein n=1 Tax=Lichenihabitans psoromatis TaxID=2528642 RepID=UPI0013F1488D|nr:phospholipase D-like domain-containing protein [Lichenihabitans psoromatis]
MDKPQARATSNNDVVMIVWHYPDKLPDCLGFRIDRKDMAHPKSAWTALPAWVGFQGQSNPEWKPNTTAVWPIQKYEWKDVTAKRGGTYAYRIVPVGGTPSTDTALDALADVTSLETDPVTLTPERGSFRAYFNRGILSTQFVSHAVKPGPSGAPDFKILLDRIDQPGDPLRNALAGQMIEGLLLLLNRAKQDGGDCYAALYELTDPELEQALLKAERLHLILSNTGTDDAENAPARQALHDHDGIDLIDRFVPSGHIGHNKFMVYVDPKGKAQAVLLGSTNWTDTAVCAQSNNALVVQDATIAEAYLAYWQRLKADTPADGKAKQSAALRDADARAALTDSPIDEGHATLWFSPNTPKARATRRGATEAVPPDLDEVFGLMRAAKHAVLFLLFQPGKPSVLDVAVEIAKANDGVFVRGAATDAKAVEAADTMLIHRPGEKPVDVVAASAIKDQFAFWQQELLKAGPNAHAIIHDKIIVIDPLSDDCVVITGSHNLGYRASYNNDENLLIVKGHKALAQAYMVHVMDIYDHYRFRYVIQQAGKQAFSGLSPNDTWQDKYFDPNNDASRDWKVWF